MPQCCAFFYSNTWQRKLLQFLFSHSLLNSLGLYYSTGLLVKIILDFRLAKQMIRSHSSYSSYQISFDMLTTSSFWSNFFTRPQGHNILLVFIFLHWQFLLSLLAGSSFLLLLLMLECPRDLLCLDLFFFQSIGFKIWSLWQWFTILYLQLTSLSWTPDLHLQLPSRAVWYSYWT